MKKLLAAAAAGAMLFIAGAANAGPAWDWKPGAPLTDFTNGSWNFGINFTVNAPVSVTGLGYYDDLGNGFIVSHEVALFSGTGTLLASGTVSSVDPLTGGFRYLNVAPLILGVGDYQVVGVSHSDLYSYAVGGSFGGLLNVDGALTYLGDSYKSDNGGGASFVGIGTGQFNNDATNGFFGPGLFLNGTVAVPEPVTLSLFGAGLAGAVAIRRRKKNKSA